MKESSGVTPPQMDIAIIGAGPHALTLVTHLLQKRKDMRRRFLVFDPSGKWISRWCRHFAALEIPHLRSPAVHHPDPDPYALRRFAESRPHELFPPYDLPGTQLFQDFCSDLIRRWELEGSVVKAKVTRIEPISRAKGCRFRLWLEDGQSAIARRVVLATGGGVPQLPVWVSQIQPPYPQERLCHSERVDLRGLQLSGERVLIVGGGLTGGHLAVGALIRGAKAILMARRQLQEKLFDADPGWLGPKYLKEFWAEPDWERRWELIQTARNGGSLTPAMLTQLRRYQRQLAILPECQVISAQWLGNRWRVICSDGAEWECDRRQARHRHPTGRDSGPLAGRHPRIISRADCQGVAGLGRTSPVARLPSLPHRPSRRTAGGAGGAESLRRENGQRADCARTAQAQSGTYAQRPATAACSVLRVNHFFIV